MNTEEKLIKIAEAESFCKVSWKGKADFYADTDGNISENEVYICQAGYFFYFSDGNFTASFYAPDVVFKDLAKRKNALAFLNGEMSKLKYTSPVSQFFGDAVTVYEFDGNRKVFVKARGRELDQLIDIAISKQKYSLTEYNKMH